jgi:hypothetical protein
VLTFLLVTVIGTLAGASIYRWYGSDARRLRRWMLQSPRARIADAPEGTSVRLVGEVIALDGHLVEAPLGAQPCVYFEAVLERISDDANVDLWKEVVRETGGVPFLLQDETGRAIVDPTHARVTLAKMTTGESGTFDDPSDRERAFLARHGQPEKLLVFNRSYRYREGILEVGERVAVVGVPVREPDPDAAAVRGYREAVTRVRLAGTDARPLAISDERGAR